MNWRKYIIKPFYFKKLNIKEYTLDRILDFASKHTKYYSKFGSRLENYPVLTKGIIREEFKNLISDDLNKRKWFYNTSGGSTGEPVRLIQDMEFRNLQRIITYGQKSFAGYEFGDFMVKLWGDEREILSSRDYKGVFIDFLKNVKFLNTFNLSEEKIKAYIDFLSKHPPKLVVSYVQSAYQIAKYIKSKNLKPLELNAIMTTAGTLYPHQKRVIKEAFGAAVFNRYGSREVGNIACNKIPDSEELLVSEGVFLEVLEDGEIKKEGSGELLITSLFNYAMPLIRYKIGDVATLKREGKRQVITKLHGRSVDIFKTKDNRLIDGEYFSHLVYFMDWIEKYQFIQKDYDYIVVKIAAESLKGSDVKRIEEGIKKVMGECRVEFERVDDIPLLKSGKFRYTVSEIK